MRLFHLAGILGLAGANIIFTHIPLTCSSEHPGVNNIDGLTGCLAGQMCQNDGTCVATEMGRRDTVTRDGDEDDDSRCGIHFGNATCDPKGSYGGCCSLYGYCGSTIDYCGAGCQSGCDNLVATGSSNTVEGTAGGSAAPSSSPPRVDGRCGSAFGGATCDANGAYGACCSKYGFCGNTAAHCQVSQGCQSGCSSDTSSLALLTNTLSNPAATDDPATQTLTGEGVITLKTAPTPSSTGAVTTDGTCGAHYDNTICGDWPQGSCCSMYGFCGNTSAHCGDGCQSGPCNQAPMPPAPGPSPAPANPNGGSLAVIGKTGVPAMHAGLMPNGKVVFLDKVENYTQLNLTDGQYAYSSEWDPETNTLAPLQYKTNAFCSGGAFLPDGRWLSLGGNGPLSFIDPTVGNGFDAIRYLQRSASDASLDGQAWSEPGNKMSSARWYASAQTMPDGSIFVASGSLNGLDPTKPENNNPTWELLNAQGVTSGVSMNMNILVKNQPYYMYPFLHLMRDGNLFVFVSKSSESFDVGSNTTVATYPDLPGYYRTYPNTGGSVLLPLSSESNWDPDVVICGGGAYQDITSPTEASCGRIKPLDSNPQWEMDSMPQGRGMVEGTLLPDGTVIWVNGCNVGAQGFGLAADPTYQVLIYDPSQPLGKRWSTGPTSQIARLYHSVALLLLDGTLIIAGSNPVQMPVLTPVPNQNPSEDYVTEFRIERYVPPYLSGDNANKRPTNVQLSSADFKNGGNFTVQFDAPAGNKAVKIALYHGGYVTHSLHMNHRMLFLDNSGFVAGQTTGQKLNVAMPPNANVALPGPYVVYVTVDGIPAIGQFVSVS